MDHGDTGSAIERHLAAFNRGDLVALLDGFTPEAVFATGTEVIRGRDELDVFFGAALRDLQGQLTVESMVVEGESVACELTERVVVSGQARLYCIAAFYRLDAGRIASAKVYREGTAEV